MTSRTRRLIASLAAGLGMLVAPAPSAGWAETVVGIELVSPHRLPEAQVRQAIGVLEATAPWREAVRRSLDRLWALGLFAEVRVEAVEGPGGLVLRYHLVRRPHVREIAWRGDLELDVADLAVALGLGRGDSAEPERLERARDDLLALYRREGHFGARVSIEAATDPSENARDLTVVATAERRARLGPLGIRGAEDVPPARLRTLGLEEGDAYREATVRAGVRALETALRAAGFFEARVTAGAPAWDAATGRVALEVDVARGPEYRVELLGRAAAPEALLRERLTFADSGVVDALEVRANERQLEVAYRELGHHFVEVAGRLVEDGPVRVIRFEIQEGPAVTVAAIDFTGALPVPAEALRERMATQRPGALHAGRFRRELVDRDVRVLEAFLRGQGYPDARVGPATVGFEDDRRRARVTIPVEAGARLAIGAVAVTGATAIPAATLRGVLGLEPGRPWDPARAEEGRRAIERRYARDGYHATRVTVETLRRNGTIDVTVRVEEGPQTRVGRILVRGLVLTRERVVRRELRLAPGDPFDPVALADGERRLEARRLFDWVEVTPLTPPPLAFVDVEVTVRERRPWRLEFGAGFATEEGGRGFLEVGHDNLFGTGRSLSLRQKLSAGGTRTGFADRTEARYRDARIFGTQWDAELNLFRERREDIGFDLERYGGAIEVQQPLFPARIAGLRGALRYRLEQVERSSVDPTLAAADVVAGRERIASVTPALSLDRRDDPLDPTRGSLHLVSVEVARDLLGSEVEFVKTRLETAWYFDWLPPTVFAVAARLGLATTLGDTVALPIEDRFFAGGATSVRGYRENRLGPRDAAGNPVGGNALVVLSAEWRFPLWRMVGGAVFADVGAVAPEVDDLDLDDFRTGVGAGLRIKTPVGPIRLDVGYALDPTPGERRLQFYLTVGYPF